MTAFHRKVIFVVDPLPITYCGVACAVREGLVGVLSWMAKVPKDELAETAVVWTLSRALTRQYHVPVPNVWLQLVAACHADWYAIEAKVFELLTST